MIKRIAILLGGACLCAATAPDQSRTVTLSSIEGGVLVAECQKREGFGFDPCVAYILGVLDASSAAGEVCPKGGSLTYQAIGVVRKFIKDHPEFWDRAPVWLVKEPLKATFPCPWNRNWKPSR